MSRRRWGAAMLGMVLALLCVAVTPARADAAELISTADELRAVLSATSAQTTKGKTYALANDIEIDTSDLQTDFSTSVSGRQFAGTFDGAGHTITVTAPASGAASQPLFGKLTGSSTARAVVQNLKLVFEGDARGATLAAGAGDALVSGVSVSFKGVTPAVSGNTSVSAGLIGYVLAGADFNGNYTLVQDVTVTGDAVGAADVQGTTNVYSAGVLCYGNAVGHSLLKNVKVNVGTIQAKGSGSGEAVASGAVASGMYGQDQSAVCGVTVTAGDVTAVGTGSGRVFAQGMASHPLAVSDSHVIVSGSVVAADEGNGGCGIVMASGFARQADNFRNADLGIASDNVTVKVDGSVETRTKGGRLGYASGFAYSLGADSSWKNASVKVGKVAANDTGSNASFVAVAAGFANTAYNYNRSDYEGYAIADGASVTADAIEAKSPAGCAYAIGFQMYDYYPFRNCEVNAGSISSDGSSDSVAAGFGYVVMGDGYASTPFSSGTAFDGCSVSADSIVANGSGDDLGAAGFSYTLEYGTGGDKYVAKDCSVTIAGELDAKRGDESAPTLVGLFAMDNSGQTHLEGNSVTLPRAATDVVAIDGSDYVRFTASENDGQAGKEGWETGNKVTFSDARGGGEVTCAFDESSSEHHTLWKLPDLRYGDLKVSAEASGDGASADDEFEFTVTLDDASINGAFGDMTFVNGVATFRLKSGASLQATGLPEGVGYVVKVTAPDGYEVIDAVGTEGAVEKDATANVHFSLRKEGEPEPTPGTDEPSGPDQPVTPDQPATPSGSDSPAKASAVPNTGDAGVAPIGVALALSVGLLALSRHWGRC